MHNTPSNTPPAPHPSEYQAFLQAVFATNKMAAKLRKSVDDERLAELPSSHRGNMGYSAPLYWQEELWVTAHGALRQFGGTLGSLLDTNNLEDNSALNKAIQSFQKDRLQYRDEVKDFLAIATHTTLHTPPAPEVADKSELMLRLFTYLHNAIPPATPHRHPSGCPMIRNDKNLDRLRRFQASGAFADAYLAQETKLAAAETLANSSYQALETLLKQQPEIVLGWRDSSGQDQHWVVPHASHETPKNRGELCYKLWITKLASQVAQVDPTQHTEAIAKTLRNTLGVADGVLRNWGDFLRSRLTHPGLQHHMIETFAQLPEVQNLYAMLPVLIPEMEQKNPKLAKAARHTLAALEKIPEIAHYAQDHPPYQPKPSKGHWCTKVIAELGKLPNEIGMRWY